MKVLTVCHRMPFFGGAEMVILKLCEYMAAQGIKNTVVVPKMPGEMFGQMPAIPVIETGGKGTTEKYFNLRNQVRFMANVENYDVINVHNFPATLALWGVKKPVVWMCNEPPEVFDIGFNIGRKLLLALNRYFVRHYVTEAIVADEFNAQRFKKIYGFEPHIIPYGVDYDFWAKGKRRLGNFWTNKKINVGEEEFTILQVGTVTRLKNQMATVQAAAKLKDIIPNLQVYFIGWDDAERDYTREVKAAVEANRLNGCVHFVGGVGRVTLREMYKRANLVVHPIKSQGGWLTPFEAMAAGAPVIVSNEATCSQLILKNALGYAAANSNSLADLIRMVYEGEIIKAEKMARSAQQWVKDNLTWDKFCSAYVGVMEEAVEKFEGVPHERT